MLSNEKCKELADLYVSGYQRIRSIHRETWDDDDLKSLHPWMFDEPFGEYIKRTSANQEISAMDLMNMVAWMHLKFRDSGAIEAMSILNILTSEARDYWLEPTTILTGG